MTTVNHLFQAYGPLIAFLTITVVVVYLLFRTVAKHQVKSMQVALYHASIKIKQTELAIEYYAQLLGHISYIRTEYLIGFSDHVKALGAQFAEDINAAVELNNTKKEQQLSKAFRSDIKAMQKQVNQDLQKLEVVIEQFVLLAPNSLGSDIAALNSSAKEIFKYVQSHLEHLSKMANDPFGTASQTTNEQDCLLSEQLQTDIRSLSKHYQAFLNKEKPELILLN